jgi:hypothetical protein
MTNMTYGICGCCISGIDFGKARSFLTTEEKVSMLKEYKDELEREVQGVTDRISGLEDK